MITLVIYDEVSLQVADFAVSERPAVQAAFFSGRQIPCFHFRLRLKTLAFPNRKFFVEKTEVF